MNWGKEMVSSIEIKRWLEAGFKDAVVNVSGDGRHFDAVIISADFAGKNSLQRHRMVYTVLGEKMADVIHALSIKTYTPDENKK